ncbi:MAG: T9SS type A sorting domain-containing protein, partial [Bacteroidota bacterium]
TNESIVDVIAYSIDARVLSDYTAFIALEPEQGGDICTSEQCEDDSGTPTSGEADRPGQFQINVYPNPFQDRLRIEVQFEQRIDLSEVTASVYDVTGRLITRLRPSEQGIGDRASLAWAGTDSAGRPVANGVYLIVIDTPQGRQTVKAVKA